MDTVTTKKSSKLGVPAIILDYSVYKNMFAHSPGTLNRWARNGSIVVMINDPEMYSPVDDERVGVVIRNTGLKSEYDFYVNATSVLLEASNFVPVLAVIQPNMTLHEALEDLGVLVVLNG